MPVSKYITTWITYVSSHVQIKLTSSLATSFTSQSMLCVYVCVSVSVTDSLSSGRPLLRSMQRSMQDSLSMVESWRKVIPGLSMIKLTPHRVSQIRFCALDTVAAAYSTLSRVQSHLSCWHHCLAITVSERANVLGQHCGKRIKEILSLCLSVYHSLSPPAFDFKEHYYSFLMLFSSWCRKKVVRVKKWRDLIKSA